MLKISFTKSNKVEVEPIKRSQEDLWYSQFDTTSRELDDLNESLFHRNSLMMKQLESVQMGF